MSCDKPFEIVTTSVGVTSIRNTVVNEIMHNPVGPWQEAHELYINPSRLSSRLDESPSPLVVFDVGLGAAANALAAFHTAKKLKKKLHMVSFEVDLRLLAFALENSVQFAHFKGFEDAMETLLKKDSWKNEHLQWTLYRGDFLETVSLCDQQADIVYYDPYSLKHNPTMWSTKCFRQLRKKCRPGVTFHNYSQATPIRAALLEAGFYVGFGTSIGQKEATTEAALKKENLQTPLDERWLNRWRRSSVPYPPLCENKESARVAIESHPQFS